MTCSTCNGQTATDVTGTAYCVLCGENVTLKREKRIVTASHIDSLRTADGGWTRETLASLGVGWPPPKGWKEKLCNGDPMYAALITDDTAEYKPLMAEELSQ